MAIFRKLAEFVLSAFYPERCSVCGEVVEREETLCEKCKSDIFPLEGAICHKCGVALKDHNELKCNEIGAEVVSAYYYRGSVRNLIIDFKDTGRKRYFDFFSHAFFEAVAREYSDIKFDIVVCVPSQSKRRGTSVIICEETARRLLLEFDKDTLEKYRQTQKQHHLSMKERFHNLDNSIRVRQGKESFVRDKIVLLCDDVKTTGTTLGECAKALYEAGAKNVYCACLAVSDYSAKKD